MTVEDIKEYIDKHHDDDEECNTTTELRTLYGETLDKIKFMLEQLDERPKANWLYSADEGEAPYYRCSNCGHISGSGTEEICESCGVEMVEFEL